MPGSYARRHAMHTRPALLPLDAARSGPPSISSGGTKRRASLHLLSTLEGLDPGGVEVFDIDVGEFAARLRRESHTVKRALTDPHLFAGIGNAYSDEILHEAGLLPLRKRTTLKPDEVVRLHAATGKVLRHLVEA